MAGLHTGGRFGQTWFGPSSWEQCELSLSLTACRGRGCCCFAVPERRLPVADVVHHRAPTEDWVRDDRVVAAAGWDGVRVGW
eukprot:scaffold21988_cov63-Phaeocystis_antarctica.AAC.8